MERLLPLTAYPLTWFFDRMHFVDHSIAAQAAASTDWQHLPQPPSCADSILRGSVVSDQRSLEISRLLVPIWNKKGTAEAVPSNSFCIPRDSVMKTGRPMAAVPT